MNKPSLIDGSNEQELPLPTKPTRTKIYGESDQETLGGATNTDVLYWKYQYEFDYPNMKQADYDNIEDFIDSAEDLRLSWLDRWPDLVQKKVKARIQSAKDFIGSGTNPYIQAKITIIETEARS